jgi:hypothetical protein
VGAGCKDRHRTPSTVGPDAGSSRESAHEEAASRVRINQVPRALNLLIDETLSRSTQERYRLGFSRSVDPQGPAFRGIGAGEKRLKVVDSDEEKGRLP